MSINAFCLFVRQGSNGSVELFPCELTLVNFIGREGNKQGTVFNAVITVEGVISFVVAYSTLIGLLCLTVFFKDIEHLIGNVKIYVLCYMGIVSL
ncbi:hypothetical protein D3C78_1022720 [compost metagenome]